MHRGHGNRRLGEVIVALWVAGGQALGTAAAARHDAGHLPVWGAVLLVTSGLLLALARAAPLPVLAAELALALAYQGFEGPSGPTVLAVAIAYVLAIGRAGRAAHVFVGAAYLGWVLLVTPSAATFAGVAAWALVVGLLGEFARSRRELAHAAADRRRQRQAAQEEERQRRQSEERLAMARELHDVLAHSLSLINVQAGVALELMDVQPERVRPALDAIKVASREAVVEVQDLLRTLRGSPTTAPAPSLRDVDGLLRGVRDAGLDITVTSSGLTQLSAAVDLAACRIVQESLTNVLRHAQATRARVELTQTAAELTVSVSDEGGGPDPGPPGNGIVGMRERVQALGGTLVAQGGPSGFTVRATLPLASR